MLENKFKTKLVILYGPVKDSAQIYLQTPAE